jgi:TM2 domain-containing membrane protein YozV
MERISKLSSVFVLSFLLLLLSSAVPAYKNKNPISEKKYYHALSSFQKAGSDGKLTYRELKKNAVDLKGEELTIKEKIGLKLFGKKIASKEWSSPAARSEKSQLVALLLCFFLGGFGVHRFYLGYTWQGLVQLFTLGGCGIWAIIDFIRIITGDLEPKNGPYDKTFK